MKIAASPRPTWPFGMAVDLQPRKGQGVTAFAAVAASSRTSAASSGGLVRGAEGFHERLQEVVRAQGLAARVRFLGARKDAANVLNALDVVIPSRSGASLIEAMALGRPVVASAAGAAGARPRALCAHVASTRRRTADRRRGESAHPPLCGSVPAANATC